MLTEVNVLTPTEAKKLSMPIVTLGFLLGLILSVGVLMGDSAGRVNLMHLLLVILVLPLCGAIVSVLSLASKKGVNLARLVSILPIWTHAQQLNLHKFRQMHADKQWFFLQSQAAALAYSVASLVALIILLLTTDINFVWRSTLLNAQQLLPALEAIATPWWFWTAAQPTLEMLQATQDSRLAQTYADTSGFGQWWPFVFATQLVYSFVVRLVLLAVAKTWLLSSIKNDIQQALLKQRKQAPKAPTTAQEVAPLTHHLPEDYWLNNWAKLNTNIVEQLKLAPVNNSELASPQVLLVKAWEPPLGELEDLMHESKGVLFPINYVDEKVVAPESRHLMEWQRFVKQLPSWQVYSPTHWDGHE